MTHYFINLFIFKAYLNIFSPYNLTTSYDINHFNKITIDKQMKKNDKNSLKNKWLR